MRYIFWLLILFNLAAFLNYTVLNSNGAHSPHQSQSTGRPLVMLQEEEPPPIPDADELPDPVASSESGTDEAEEELSTATTESICYAIAPFKLEKDTSSVISVIEQNGLKGKAEEVVLRIPTGGYWVFLPPLESRTAAKKIAGELASKGVADYYILTGGEYKNAISLGLYSGKVFAEKRAAVIRKDGYDPVVSPRYRVERHFAVKYVVPAGYEFDEQFTLMIDEAGKGARQEIIDCVSVEDLIQ